MRKLLPILCIAGSLIAGPALAKDHPGKGNKGGTCKTHSVAYRVNGTLVSSSLTLVSPHHYSGTITMTVRTANAHAKVTKGTTQTYTLTDAKVRFGHKVDPSSPAAGSRVQLEGKITAESKHCTAPYFVGVLTVKRVTILAAKKHGKP